MTPPDAPLTVAVAQLTPVWLDRDATLAKVEAAVEAAAGQGADLVVFGEAFVPGYPFWLDATGGAQFDSPRQKSLFAHYAQEAVSIERGDLVRVCRLARENDLAVYLGIVERPADRGGHSLYCSLVYIDATGLVQSVHRKLQPTYEERLVWAPGDGHGLRTHPLGAFTVGGLNCWENWMPTARAALYALGENVHVAVWPGNHRNTERLTPMLAQEGRSFVVSVSALFGRADVPGALPFADELRAALPEVSADGGSCVAAPDGSWVLPPVRGEGVFTATLDVGRVLEERQNFDPSGHYSRPDVLRLDVNRERQRAITLRGE